MSVPVPEYPEGRQLLAGKKVLVTAAAGTGGKPACARNAFFVDNVYAAAPFRLHGLPVFLAILGVNRGPISAHALLRKACNFMGQRFGFFAGIARWHNFFTQAQR